MSYRLVASTRTKVDVAKVVKGLPRIDVHGKLLRAYPTAEGRTLAIYFAKEYPDFKSLKKHYNYKLSRLTTMLCSRAHMELATYLWRKSRLPYGIFNYPLYVAVTPKLEAKRYTELFKDTWYFSKDELNYIFGGEYEDDPAKVLASLELIVSDY